MTLDQLTDEELDGIISMLPENRNKYFAAMIKSHFPKIVYDSEDYHDLLGTYISSFYTEKLYRSNRFFNEKFTPVYTKQGMIRNIIADIYFNADDLITH